MHRGGGIRPREVMRLLRHVADGAGSVSAGQLLFGAGSVPAGQLLSGAGAVPAGQLLSGAGAIPAGKLLSGAGAFPAGKLLSGAGYRCGGGMVLSKRRGWAAGITSRAFSSNDAGLIDCGILPHSMRLEPLSHNQLYLMQLIDNFDREARLLCMEIQSEEVLIANEWDKINALDRDVLVDSCKKVGVMVWRIFVTLGGGFIFYWNKDASSTAGGAASSSGASSFSAGGSCSSGTGAGEFLPSTGGSASSAPVAGEVLSTGGPGSSASGDGDV